MDKFQNFEDWLKANHQLNWRENIILINSIDRTLMVPNFQNISSVPILNQLMSALRSNVTFGSKAKTERDKEIKTFKLYIKFKEEEKINKGAESETETEQ